jgi:hypothetical protein
MPRLNRDLIRDWLVDHDKTIAWLADEADIPKTSLANALCPSADPLRLARVRRLSKVTGILEADLVAEEKKQEEEDVKVEKTGPDRRENGGSGTGPKRPNGAAA